MAKKQTGIEQARIIAGIVKGVQRMKRIEVAWIPVERQNDSAWLQTVNDIIDRTALAIRDNLVED